MKNPTETLWYKLRDLYNQGNEIELTMEESIIYSIEYADEWPFDDENQSKQEVDYNG